MYLILLESIKNDKIAHIKNLFISPLLFFFYKRTDRTAQKVKAYISHSSGQINPKQEKQDISPNGRKAFWANLEYASNVLSSIEIFSGTNSIK